MLGMVTRKHCESNSTKGELCLHLQTREVLEAMKDEAEAGAVKLLRVDGGASTNDLLMQIQADALQVAQLRPTPLHVGYRSALCRSQAGRVV